MLIRKYSDAIKIKSLGKIVFCKKLHLIKNWTSFYFVRVDNASIFSSFFNYSSSNYGLHELVKKYIYFSDFYWSNLNKRQKNFPGTKNICIGFPEWFSPLWKIIPKFKNDEYGNNGRGVNKGNKNSTGSFLPGWFPAMITGKKPRGWYKPLMMFRGSDAKKWVAVNGKWVFPKQDIKAPFGQVYRLSVINCNIWVL